MLQSLLLSAQKSISIILIILMMPFNFANLESTHEPKNPDEVKTSFTVLSDCHIEGNNLRTFEVFEQILKDVKSSERNDALVFLGDNVMNGQFIENNFFYGGLKAAGLDTQLIVAPGNHDFSNDQGSYSVYLNRFLGYNNIFLGANLTSPYYFRVINGCYFIVLSSEEATVDEADISDKQLKWLSEVLDEAEKTGNPIFVFNHHPADYIVGESDRLTDVLCEYDNLIYFCGHTHLPLRYGTFYECNSVQSINLPKSTEHAVEAYECGVGAVVEVYEDEVLVRMRNFCDGKWIPEYERSYPITK